MFWIQNWTSNVTSRQELLFDIVEWCHIQLEDCHMVWIMTQTKHRCQDLYHYFIHFYVGPLGLRKTHYVARRRRGAIETIWGHKRTTARLWAGWRSVGQRQSQHVDWPGAHLRKRCPDRTWGVCTARRMGLGPSKDVGNKRLKGSCAMNTCVRSLLPIPEFLSEELWLCAQTVRLNNSVRSILWPATRRRPQQWPLWRSWYSMGTADPIFSPHTQLLAGINYIFRIKEKIKEKE